MKKTFVSPAPGAAGSAGSLLPLFLRKRSPIYRGLYTLLLLVAGGGALPLQAQQLEDFSAENINRQVILSWEVDSEPQPGTYQLQRSLDGAHWESFRKVEAKARRGAGEGYQIIDKIDAAYSYYRLQFKPANSTAARVLGVTYVDLNAASLFVKAQPDPAKQLLNLHYTLDKDKRILVRVFDQIGQEVWTQQLPSGEAGVYDVQLEWSRFKRGIYLLVFTQVDRDLDLADTRIEY